MTDTSKTKKDEAALRRAEELRANLRRRKAAKRQQDVEKPKSKG